MNEKAKAELSPRDLNTLSDLLAKDVLTPTEVKMLAGRKDYLTQEELKKLGLKPAPKKVAKKKSK